MKLIEPGKPLLRVEQALPDPGPQEVLVRIKAVSLNFRDALILQGHYPLPVKHRVVPLSDGAGEIAAVGSAVRSVAVGDKVVTTFFPAWRDGPISAAQVEPALGGTSDGVLASHVLLPAEAVLPFANHLSFEAAATLPCAAVTAWNALSIAEIGKGKSVLLLGTGGVSIFGLQLAKYLGATVIQTSSSDEKLARAAAMGADHVINYRKHPEWSREVERISGGRGVDLVVEVGGPGTLAQSIASTRLGGTIAAIGFVGGLGPVEILPLMAKAANLRSILVGSHAMYADMNRAMESGRIDPVIDSIYSLDEFDRALGRLAEGPFGKVVIRL